MSFFSSDFAPQTQSTFSDFINDNAYTFSLISIPIGYRFTPTDEELVLYYLKRKAFNEQLPPTKIVEVEFYKFNPDTLAAMYEPAGEKEWYFFTQREKKHLNGKRSNRVAGDGFWKGTTGNEPIKGEEGGVLGFKRGLTYYQGKAPDAVKTNWIMYEYSLVDSSNSFQNGDGMKLDDLVLCRIHKVERAVKAVSHVVAHENVMLQNSITMLESSSSSIPWVNNVNMGNVSNQLALNPNLSERDNLEWLSALINLDWSSEDGVSLEDIDRIG